MSVLTTAFEYTFWGLSVVLVLIGLSLQMGLIGGTTQDAVLWFDILMAGLQLDFLVCTGWLGAVVAGRKATRRQAAKGQRAAL